MHVSAAPAGLFYHLGFFVLNIDPIFFHLGPLAVHWYGLAYVVAITIALWATIRWALKEGVHDDQIWGLFIWTAVAGLIGGRLYFVIQQPDLVHNYLLNPINIIAVWNGGMAFFGAIFAGTATLFFLAPRYGMSRFLAIDGGAVFAMVGQIFGRFGNVVNGDIVGQAMSSTLVNIPASTCANAPCIAYVANDHILPWAFVYLNPHSFAPTGIPFAPAPIYEMLFNIIALAILIPLQHRLPRIRAGFFFIAYLVLYAISQFIVFFYRGSEPITPFLGITGLKQAQWTAVFVFLACIPLFYLVRRYSAPWPYSDKNPVPWFPAEKQAAEAALAGGGTAAVAGIGTGGMPALRTRRARPAPPPPADLPEWSPTRATGGRLRNNFSQPNDRTS